MMCYVALNNIQGYLWKWAQCNFFCIQYNFLFVNQHNGQIDIWIMISHLGMGCPDHFPSFLEEKDSFHVLLRKAYTFRKSTIIRWAISTGRTDSWTKYTFLAPKGDINDLLILLFFGVLQRILFQYIRERFWKMFL